MVYLRALPPNDDLRRQRRLNCADKCIGVVLIVPLTLLIIVGARGYFHPLHLFIQSSDFLVWILVALRWLALRSAGPAIEEAIFDLKHELPRTQLFLALFISVLGVSYVVAKSVSVIQLGLMEVAYGVWQTAKGCSPSTLDLVLASIVETGWVLIELLSLTCQLVFGGVCLRLAAKQAAFARESLNTELFGKGLAYMLREARPAMRRMSSFLLLSCVEFLLYAASFAGQQVVCANPRGAPPSRFSCSWIQIYYMAFHTVLMIFAISTALILSEVQLGLITSTSLGIVTGKQGSNSQVLRDALSHLLALNERGELGLRFAGVVLNLRNFWRFLSLIFAAVYLVSQNPYLFTW